MDNMKISVMENMLEENRVLKKQVVELKWQLEAVREENNKLAQELQMERERSKNWYL